MTSACAKHQAQPRSSTLAILRQDHKAEQLIRKRSSVAHTSFISFTGQQTDAMAATNTHYYADSMYNMYHHALPPTYYDNTSSSSSYYQSSQGWQPASYQGSSYAHYSQESYSESCYYANYHHQQQQQQHQDQPLCLPTLDAVPQYQVPTIAEPVIETSSPAPVKSRKRKAEESAADIIAAVEERPSTLRALLTNPVKKLKYTPDYFYTTIEHVKKPSKSSSAGELSPCYEQDYAVPTPSTQQTHMSPQRSTGEDVDYLDVYSPRKQAKHGDFITPPPAATTPVDGIGITISTPPQSPAEKSNEINHRIVTAANASNEFNWSHIEETIASGRHRFPSLSLSLTHTLTVLF